MDERQQQIQQILQQALASSTSVGLLSQAQPMTTSSQLVGGVVMLPSVGASNYVPGQLATQALVTGNVPPCVQPLVIRHGTVTSPVHDGHFIGLSSSRSPGISVPPRTPGATVHHLGTGESPFAHLRSHLQLSKMGDAGKPLVGIVPERRVSMEDINKQARKRIKLELPETVTPLIPSTTANVYRQLYIESREHEMVELRSSYQDHIMELFFLEKLGGSLMDYLVWSKRPNLPIGHLLQAESLDAVDEMYAGEEKHINNEVKVLTSGDSSIPIVTPVAIATTLPPAITALQQQGGVPLSPTAATTTVGSPPPYTFACSGSMMPPAAIDSHADDLDSILGLDYLTTSSLVFSSAPTAVDSVSNSLKSVTSTSSISSVQPLVSVHQISAALTSANTVGNGDSAADSGVLSSASHEAVVEQARQEAQVLQRIADLRRQGMWSARRLPKVQEPSRCMSHWDYLLSEMRWLAVDFAQERRWKISIAKKLAHDAVKYHARQQELRQQRSIHLAGVIAHMVEDFWTHMIEMAYYRHQQQFEKKRSELIEFVLKDLTDGSGLTTNMDDVKVNGNGNCTSDDDNEITDLLKESEMPLEELLEKYGPYESTYDAPLSSPESLSNDMDFDTDDSDGCAGRHYLLPLDTPDAVKMYPSLSELMQTASSIHPTGHNLQTSPVHFGCISLISQTLREYQLVGVNWLAAMYKLTGGCFLCDGAGLGKKVQTIGFLASLANNYGIWGAHLIVTSSLLLPAWQAEFEQWFPSVKVLVYYGEPSQRCKNGLNCAGGGDYHVVITSYTILSEDADLFLSRKWKCLVADSVTDALNNAGMLSVLLQLNIGFTIQLSSDDLIDRPPSEMMSSLQLCFPRPCRNDLDRQLQNLDCSSIGQLLNSLSLRRTELDVKSQLPSCKEMVITCDMSNRQRFCYTDYLASARERLAPELRVTDVLSLLIQLHRLADHPELVTPRPVTTSLHMDHLQYAVPGLVKLCAEEEQSLNASSVASEDESPSATDLLAELNFLMSPGTSTELPSTSISCLPETTASKMASLLFNPDQLYCEIYPDGVCQMLTRSVFETSSDLIEHIQWKSLGYLMCLKAATVESVNAIMDTARSLQLAINIPFSYIEQLRHRLLCTLPRVLTEPVQLVAAVKRTQEDPLITSETELHNKLLASLGTIDSVLLPDHRVLATASGKLLQLDSLLHTLFQAPSQRTVIFSQTLQMLDILESFMDCRHLPYVRIDATMKCTERCVTMQRFNADDRIKCLLMSTRTPLIGLPFPKLSAVIFYDVDLRPDMLEHVEKFCSSIAKKQDLTVFRLTSRHTVDSMLLRSRTNHDLLQGITVGHPAGPTTDVFSQTIVDDMTNTEQDELSFGKLCSEYQPYVAASDGFHLQKQILTMGLDEVEDAADSSAAQKVCVEHQLETNGCTDVASRLHSVIATAVADDPSYEDYFSEIERYALEYVKHQMEPPFGLEDDILQQEQRFFGKSFEPQPMDHSGHLDTDSVNDTIKNADDEDDDDMLFTYYLENDQTFICDTTGQQMPVWAPPTPPQDDSDLYIDCTQSFIYEPSVMFESQLPPVYVRKGHKRHRMDSAARKQKQRARDDLPAAPRSLFDCPQSNQQRLERTAHLLKAGAFKPAKAQMQAVAAAVGAVGIRPPMEIVQDHPEWLIHEDWALLQALQSLQELPLNLLTSSPGHTPNWDLVADIVNGCSRTFRSPKQCRNRYENFIMAREEGRPVYDPSPRKLKKASKGLYKTKSNRPMRTNQLHMQDNSKALTTLYTLRFDAIKAMAAKRIPPIRPQLSGAVGAGSKNAKHLAVLAENGINYDRPLSPVQVATMRAERIAKEKKAQAVTAAALPGTDAQAAGQQQLVAQRPAVSASGPQQLVLQSGQAVSQAAAPGHVILQPGQQLISAATGQHVLATVDGRPQMTIVQSATSGPVAASLLQSAIVRASAAAAAGNTSVVTTGPLARSINMAGIIVSQAVPGQTFAAAINKGQTVIAPLQGQNAQLRGVVRTPFGTKDITGVSVVTQAGNTLGDASVTKVMATASLTQAQLVVAQQKATGGFVGLPSLAASGVVSQQLLGLSMAPGSAASVVATATKVPSAMQQVQLMRPKQVQLRPTHLQTVQSVGQHQQVSTVPGSVATVVTGMPKTVTVTTPIITGIQTQGTVQLRGQQFQALIKRPQTQQLQQPKTAVGPGVAVQQIQVSKGQILEGIQIQQVTNSLNPQAVQLMKSGASSASAVSSVTISGASFSMAQKAQLLAGKTLQPQQIRQLQMQKRTGTMQIQGPPKVAALQPMTKIQAGTSSPVIFRPQQVVVQQMTQQPYIKQPGAQQPVQHIISSIPVPSSSSASPSAVLTTQLVGQAGSTATVAIAALQTVAKTVSVTFTTASVPGGVSSIALSSATQIGTISANTITSGASVKLLPQSATLVKSVKDAASFSVLPPRAPVQPVLVRQNTAITVSSSPAQITLATVPCPRGTAGSNQSPIVATSIQQSAVSAGQPTAMPPNVQQAVQDILQQAQGQARQQAGGFGTTTVVSNITVQQPQTNLASPTAAGGSGIATTPQSPADQSNALNKSSPYVMRLRNQRS